MYKFFCVLLIILFTQASFTVHGRTPFTTFTLGEYELIPTLQAYEAIAVLSSPEIQRPEDLYICVNDFLYIADSGTRQIIIMDSNRNVIQTVGSGILTRPTGVVADANGMIFVADDSYIFKFSPDGELIRRFERPDDPLFGQDAPFSPRKLAINARGDIFIVGDAAANGVVMLNSEGEFLRYIGANDVRMTLFQTLQHIFTPRDRRTFFATPSPPTNIAIDERGAVFTVTAGLPSHRVKRFNVAGENILPDVPSIMTVNDITMAHHGGFFTLSSNGFIIEYTAEGDLLLLFTSLDAASQRLGVFRSPTSIEQDHRGNLYVSDSETGFIHLFAPTQFTILIHSALHYFQLGRYTESMVYWEEVLRLHASFSLAHLAIANARFLDGNYNEARTHFYLAGNIDGYSESFWEVRNEWLYTNAGVLVAGFAGFWIFMKIIKRRKRFDFKEYKLLQELGHIKKILRHPIDAFYDIRFLRSATVRSAIILYALLFIVFLLSLLTAGFVFTPIRFLSIPMIMGIFIGIVSLFVIVNYLVATVNEGEGSFSDIFIGTAYSASPFILFALPITLITRVLTLNEAFIYEFSMFAIISWSLLLIFIMLKEIHDYSIRDTIKNILLTIFTSVIAVVVVFILILLLNEVYQFFSNFFVEVGTRV